MNMQYKREPCNHKRELCIVLKDSNLEMKLLKHDNDFLQKNLSKKMNLYIGFIEGNHRSVSIHFVMNHLLSTQQFITSNHTTLSTPNAYSYNFLQPDS